MEAHACLLFAGPEVCIKFIVLTTVYGKPFTLVVSRWLLHNHCSIHSTVHINTLPPVRLDSARCTFVAHSKLSSSSAMLRLYRCWLLLISFASLQGQHVPEIQRAPAQNGAIIPPTRTTRQVSLPLRIVLMLLY
jgi:hypothetical protein